MKKGTVLTIVFLGVIGYLSVSMILTGSTHQCNVCITYNGIEVCQDVEGMDKNEVIQFGKEEGEERLPKLGFSLNVPGPMSRISE